jgi:hypothetical protein
LYYLQIEYECGDLRLQEVRFTGGKVIFGEAELPCAEILGAGECPVNNFARMI